MSIEPRLSLTWDWKENTKKIKTNGGQPENNNLNLTLKNIRNDRNIRGNRDKSMKVFKIRTYIARVDRHTGNTF